MLSIFRTLIKAFNWINLFVDKLTNYSFAQGMLATGLFAKYDPDGRQYSGLFHNGDQTSS